LCQLRGFGNPFTGAVTTEDHGRLRVCWTVVFDQSATEKSQYRHAKDPDADGKRGDNNQENEAASAPPPNGQR
jgi:hypothetical protein